MKFLNKLERKIGRYAIPNLMYYIIILYAIGFVLDLVLPGFYESYLSLNAQAILHGQVWRVVTFLLNPPDSSLIFMIFALYLYYMIGRQLEYTWGAFRFNFYFFMGVIFHVVAALLAYAFTGVSISMGTSYLNLSLFFAYAAMYPNQQFYLFFVLPVKVKWLAWLDAALFGYTILQAFMPQYGGNPFYGMYYKGMALEAFVSLLNFLVFFLLTRNMSRVSPKQVYRRQQFKKATQAASKPTYSDGARHRCAVCGRTDVTNPELEFRYCSKCNGNYEYCQDHLFTHEHVK